MPTFMYRHVCACMMWYRPVGRGVGSGGFATYTSDTHVTPFLKTLAAGQWCVVELTSLRGLSNESLSKKSTSLDVTIPLKIPPSFPVSVEEQQWGNNRSNSLLHSSYFVMFNYQYFILFLPTYLSLPPPPPSALFVLFSNLNLFNSPSPPP